MMKKIWSNSLAKIVLFFGIGISFLLLFQKAMLYMDGQGIKGRIGIYPYYMAKYIFMIAVGMAVCILLSKWIRGKDVPVFKIDKSTKQNLVRGILLGGSMPVLILGIPFIILTKVGWIQIQGWSKEMSLLAGFCIALNVMSTAIFEELGFRSFAFGLLYEKYSFWKAALITSVFFAIMHMGQQINIVCCLNLFLLSVVFIQLDVLCNTIWASIIGHFVWNYLHMVLLSLKMYGVVCRPHLLEVGVAGNPYLSGGEIGLEGSLIVTVMLCLSVFGLYEYRKRK